MSNTINNPTHTATAENLAALRADGQWSRRGLVIHRPVTVYTARIDQTFTTLDNVVELTYDTGSGTRADVLEGMAVFVGSTAGARDKGVTVIRKAPTSTTFYIRPTSNISFANNDHITIVDAFQLTGRPIYHKGGVVMMDTDVEFGDLTRGGALARLGPLAAVIEQTSGTLTFAPVDPSLSEALDGANITDYEFDAPDALTTSYMTDPALAAWTYPLTADGQYRFSCKLTDDLTRETTGYRRVFVNPAEIPFKMEEEPEGSLDADDWKFTVTAYADVDDLFEGAMVVLYRRDIHGGVAGSIGKLAGYENIEAIGWIDGEVVEQDDHAGWYTFSVYGPAHWMAKTAIDPLELTSTLADAANWNQVQNMTVDMVLARVLYWMTTAPLFMDCFLTGDTRKLRTCAIQGGYLFDALKSIAADKVFASLGCNNYGQLFIFIDPQIADGTTRASYPIVMDITSDDYEGKLEIERNTSGKTALLQLDAFQSSDGVADIFLHARAPGNVPNIFGQPSSYQDYIVEDAAECRRISGQLLAIENNEYEPITITFPAALNLFDVAPPMVATLTTDGSDNPRGIALTAQRLIPRKITKYIENGQPKTEVTFEFEVTGVAGVNYFPPTVEEPNLDLPLDDFSGVDFPSSDDLFPEVVPPDVDTPCDRALGNSFTLVFSPRALTGSTSQLIARAYFPCKIRATGSTAGDTKIILQYHAFGDAESHKACYAVRDGTRVLTGVWSGDVITFSPVSDTEISGFEIELEAGAGSVIDRWEIGQLIETGVMGTATTECVTDNYYVLKAYKGYWTATFPPEAAEKHFYNVKILPSNEGYVGGKGLDGFGDFHLDMTNCMFVDRAITSEVFNPDTQQFEVGGNYARCYFQSGSGSDQQKTLYAADTLTLGLEYHDMAWALYEAQAIGRQLVIGNSTLYNVCAI